MVDYVKFGAHAWTSIVNRESLMNGQGPSKDSVSFFHYQLHQWQQELAPAVRFDSKQIEADDTFFTSTDDEIGTYVKTLLYLRSNQIRILVLRPLLIYPQAARNSPTLIKELIGIARRSIGVLNSMATNSDIYRTRQMIFNHFLSSALAVLFLAAANDAETQTAESESGSMLEGGIDELQLGLDVIDHHRARSDSAEHLWQNFARPRRQLIRLGFLKHRQREGARGENPMDDDALDGFSTFDPQFDIDQFGMDDENSLQWLEWFEGAFMNSSVPAGMPSWM